MPSTQDPAKEAARGGEPNGTVFVTDYQSEGRGRRDRSWLSAPGVDLTFSAIFRMDAETRHARLLSFAAALAVASALEGRFAGKAGEAGQKSRAGIKWPNDVLVDGRKICGIICESSGTSERLGYAVLGIGVNVNSREPDSPERPQATSVLAAFGERSDLPRLMADILNELEPRSAMVADRDGRMRLMEEYRVRCCTIGQEVRIISDDGEIFSVFGASGTVSDVTDDGELILSSGGRTYIFNAADVVHARAY
jgi:BirA family biotin operon repressor/biotin-[acetyl-CoA-carboxylase] ligase